MFRVIASGALGRLLGVVHFLVCTKWVLRWNYKHLQKQFKINGLDRFRGTHFLGPISAKSVPMQRGARFAFSGSAPMQRGARFWIFDALLGGPTWPSEGVRNIYKPHGILHILQTIEKRSCPRNGRERLTYSKFVGKMNTLRE